MSTQADHVDAALQYLRDVVQGTAKADATRIAAARAIIPCADADDPNALLYLAQVVAGDEIPNRDRVAAARVLAPGVAAEPPPTQQTQVFMSAGTGNVLGTIEGENPSNIALLNFVYDGEGFPAFAEEDPYWPLPTDEPAPHGYALDGVDTSLAGTSRTGYTMQEKRTEHVEVPVGPAVLHAGQGYGVSERPPLVLPND